MKAHSVISLLALSGITLLSCNPGGEYRAEIITPVGAPTIALVPFDDQFSSFTQVDQIPTQFLANKYDVIIFDAINGLRVINKNNSPFKLHRTITSGNYYLVSINKDEGAQPDKDSKVVVFGENTTGDYVFKNLYPEVTNIKYVAGVSIALEVAKVGTYGNENIDFVLLAQPALTGALNSTVTSVKVVSHLGSKWKETYDNQVIPQAGLFIRDTAYDEHLDYYTDFLNKFDLSVSKAKDDIDGVIEDIRTLYKDKDMNLMEAKYGFGLGLIKAAYNVNSNPFGLLSDEDFSNIKYNDFLTNLNQPLINEDLIV